MLHDRLLGSGSSSTFYGARPTQTTQPALVIFLAEFDHEVTNGRKGAERSNGSLISSELLPAAVEIPRGPHRYHAYRRIEKAKYLLAKSTQSVTEIGMIVGRGNEFVRLRLSQDGRK
jgi:hypothetical protein